MASFRLQLQHHSIRTTSAAATATPPPPTHSLTATHTRTCQQTTTRPTDIVRISLPLTSFYVGQKEEILAENVFMWFDTFQYLVSCCRPSYFRICAFPMHRPISCPHESCIWTFTPRILHVTMFLSASTLMLNIHFSCLEGKVCGQHHFICFGVCGLFDFLWVSFWLLFGVDSAAPLRHSVKCFTPQSLEKQDAGGGVTKDTSLSAI